ncbi:hypothetical protein K438DRAFT_1957720 [Mycena galopus ATCC 62051]|nr:hypothetical protein K438DRAFT_1957720 [Mycena galopus ATCC 62051]
MFVNHCLSCGKELDDERAYCNEECQSGDLTSLSSDSSELSAFSSPSMQYSNGLDLPPSLVPSALGRALRAYTAHDRYSASSSSASSTSWSLLTDDDDSEFDGDNTHDSLLRRPNALSYARRPSGTNNPHPRRHCRTASSSSSLVCALPQSAPGDAPSFRHFLDDDDDFNSSSDFAPEAVPIPTSTITPTSTASKSSSRHNLRKRNRASLPTYFSMLQISSPSAASDREVPMMPHSARAGASPVSCSSGHTIAAPLVPGRPSPPTPKLSLLAGVANATNANPTTHTPRGRRRGERGSTSSRGEGSRSPSASRRRDSDEKVADWSRRGRASVRRNSSASPPPSSHFAHLVLGASPHAIMGDSSASRERARTRGRARVEELEGPGSAEHPGFGFGRSGLVGRARRGVGEEWVGLGR